MLGQYAYVFRQDTKLDGGGWFNGKFVGESQWVVLLAVDERIKPHCDHAEVILDLNQGAVLRARAFHASRTFNGHLRWLALDGIHLNGLLPGMPDDITACHKPLTMLQMEHIANQLEEIRTGLVNELNDLTQVEPNGPVGHMGWKFESTRQAAQTVHLIKVGIEELRERIAAIKESPTRGGTIVNNDTVNILQIASDFNIGVPA